MSARDAVRVDVYKGHAQVGELRRTQHGASFSYAEPFVAAHHDDRSAAIAFGMPVRSEAYEVFGVNLHPFFAGLLPEGLRLRALVRSLKTSEDDLFTLLAACGAETIGDVYVSQSGKAPREHAPVADVRQLSEVSFDELLEQSLDYDRAQPELSLAGVQLKVSAATISLPLRARARGHAYILKPTPAEYPKLAENEAFFMRLAKSCGLPVARTTLVHDRSGRSGLLVQRFDRASGGPGGVTRLHQEDACQLLDRYPADKYRLALSEIANALEICSAPLPERLKLLRMQAFAYLIANGDLHAKNISVQVAEGRVVLTPAYDVLSTLPYGDRKLALPIEGRDDNVKATHFIALGERVGLRRAAVQQMLAVLCKKVVAAVPRLETIGLGKRESEHLARMMRERVGHLQP